MYNISMMCKTTTTFYTFLNQNAKLRKYFVLNIKTK